MDNKKLAAHFLKLAKVILAEETPKQPEPKLAADQMSAKEMKRVAKQLRALADELDQNAKAMQNWRVPGEQEALEAELGASPSAADVALEGEAAQSAAKEKATTGAQ